MLDCGVAEECPMVVLTDKRTGVAVTMPIERAAELMQLDVVDIEWAIEEYGECETDAHLCRDPR
jgi:hypothetical protein